MELVIARACPAVVKWQLLKQLPPATHRLATVRPVNCNPLALSLAVRGLALAETNGQPFASLEEFYANFQLSTLFRWAGPRRGAKRSAKAC